MKPMDLLGLNQLNQLYCFNIQMKKMIESTIVSIRESVDVRMYFCQGAHYEVRFYKEGEVFGLDIFSGESPNLFKEHSGHLDNFLFD